MEDNCKYHQRLLQAFMRFPAQPSALTEGVNHLVMWCGLKEWWHKTFYGVQSDALQLVAQGEYNEALSLLIKTLTEQQFWFEHSCKWWNLMRLAINIAHRLHMSAQSMPSEPLHLLMKLSNTAPQPWQGRDVAVCFTLLSLWALEEEKNQKALDKIRIAMHADPTWGYAEYLLGHYGLVLEGIDSVNHFINAIKIDAVYWQHLKEDPTLRAFPDILQAIPLALQKPNLNS